MADILMTLANRLAATLGYTVALFTLGAVIRYVGPIGKLVAARTFSSPEQSDR